MTGKTHLMAGAVAGTFLSLSTGADALSSTAIISASLVGSLLPDIDHIGSKAGRNALPVSVPVRIFFGHRTITHSLLFVALLYLVGMHFLSGLPGLAWGLSIGAFTHLLLDSLNPAGVPLLYPWPKKMRIASIRTGGFGEMMFVLAGIVALIGIGFRWIG